MSESRQQLLILYAANSNLESEIVGWSLYDGTGAQEFEATGPEEKPPYSSVLAAMREGWRVIQVPPILPRVEGQEYRVGPLRFEFVLEKIQPRGQD